MPNTLTHYSQNVIYIMLRLVSLSSHDVREVLGIGAAAQIDELEIHWPAPSKRIEKLTNLAPNRYIHIVEDKGMV